MTCLLDTGFFFALLNSSDSHHKPVSAAALQLVGKILLPTVVTTEVAYLVQRDMGAEALAKFMDQLAKGAFTIEEPANIDFQRAAEVVRQYADSHIDFVDAIIVAMAERLEITKILTIDTRHFRMFRPKHCEAFELFP